MDVKVNVRCARSLAGYFVGLLSSLGVRNPRCEDGGDCWVVLAWAGGGRWGKIRVNKSDLWKVSVVRAGEETSRPVAIEKIDRSSPDSIRRLLGLGEHIDPVYAFDSRAEEDGFAKGNNNT